MDAYSLDLRKRVLAACDAGHGTKEVAKVFDVSPSWVRRLKQRRRELGTIAPLPCRAGRKPKFSEADLRRLRDLVEQQPDATLKELQSRLGMDVTTASICRRLQELRLSFKKKSCTPASKTGRTSEIGGTTGMSSSTAWS
jgi:transposase